MHLPRLVIAGTASGVGKTTVMVALAAALRARGLVVAPFKCGPDYLDPRYHELACGRPAQTLDGWMMGRDGVLRALAAGADGADIALVEGVMGLFDGASPTSDAGSSAQVARWTETPVALVLDAKGGGRSLVATALGFARFDPRVPLGAVLTNRLGSDRHRDLIRDAFTQRAGQLPPFVGGLRRRDVAVFPERHLGLVTASEEILPPARTAELAQLAEDGFDLDALLELARSAPPLEVPAPVAAPRRVEQPPSCRIAVAKDDAFHFYYHENLARLRQAGAELVPFSPLVDDGLPPDVQGVYLGGGYPEVHAEQLARSPVVRVALPAFVRAGGVLYAECGGLMVLADQLRTTDGREFPMAGILPGVVQMHDRLQALGYAEVETIVPSILGPEGRRFRGHEFRYSSFEPRSSEEADSLEEPDPSEEPDSTEPERIYRVRKRRGTHVSQEGYGQGSVLASYVHAHWASNPTIPEALVGACRAVGQIPC